MLSAQNDKKWLVKSENKILGPYSIEQVENLIFKKQISLIDEIRDMDTRWLYIRENPAFKKIIDDVRNQIDAKSDATKTFQTGHSGSNTAAINTFTGTIKDEADDSSAEGTSAQPKLTSVSLEPQEASVVTETVEDVINRVKESESEKAASKAKYTFRSTEQIRQEKSSFSKTVFIVIAFIFVAGLGVVGSYYFYNKYNQQKMENELLVEIKKAKFIGLDSKAVTLFSKLPSLVQKQYLVEMVSLFPMLEAAGLAQVKDLDRLEGISNLSLETKAQIFLARFWMYMQTQNFEEAQNQIIKAKNILPQDNMVNENEAILNLKRGKYTAALDAFLKLYKSENSGRYLVGAVQSLQGLTQQDRAKYLVDVEKLVDRHIALRADFKKELLLVQMYFAKLHSNDILFKLSWKNFINTPVQLSQLFRRPPLLAPFSYLWKDLDQYRAVVAEGLNPADETLFKIHDFLESSQLSAATEHLEKNKAAINDVAMKQQMSLLVFYSLNKVNEILSIEKTKQLDMKSELNHTLLALTKVNSDSGANLHEHMIFFKENSLKFQLQWVQLLSLVKRKAVTEIRPFLRENSLEDTDFILALEARGMLE